MKLIYYARAWPYNVVANINRCMNRRNGALNEFL